MERINASQLGAMIILFQIGSTTLFELGIDARQDAWLVVLLSCVSGLLLLWLYLSIQRRDPERNVFGILVRYLGSWLGGIVVCFYIAYFAYESMRNVRDFGDLTNLTVLPRTPPFLVMLVLSLLSMYALFKGIEVFFRFVEFIVIGVIFFYVLLAIFYVFSGIVRLERIFPVLERGPTPVLSEVYGDSIWFPFGQMFVFLTFWRLLQEKQRQALRKVTFQAYLVSGAVIFMMNTLTLSVLGPDFAKVSTIPLLQSTQLIQLADILERFDVLVFLLLYVGIFVKATLWFLAAVIGLGEMFRRDYRWFVLPVGGAIYAAALLPRSWQAHLETGDLIAVKYMLNPIMLGIVPALLLVVMWIRGPLGKLGSSGRS
ncbi:GerAB/ArcD/ProY family transporter [Paenibacillus sp.]|uniref:GerAB/ArcD/ProY family transporter n=1 Tax=Paenibacillus sp. TaxID=58172 RepID=UPI002812097A|nr:GerAB/ArcD/ProY family transporter [Paenibacillus sp.]